MTPLLEARGVSKVFTSGTFNKTSNVALSNVTMEIDADKPSVTAIVGESGSGKTTLVRLLLGLIPPTSGQVLYRGQDLSKLDKRQRGAFLREVQTVFQDPFEVYNPFYKVDHVLEMPIRNFKLAASKDEARAKMEEVLSAVGLRPDETLGRFPHQLSGGQRQRIMVARALLLQPKVIIADEPVSMVDASLRATILESLLVLRREFGISLLYITHDLTTAYQVSDDVVVFYRGTVAEAGNAELVVPQPAHPYTQLLIGSIPMPDTSIPWEGENVFRGIERQTYEPAGNAYCRFYNRCPYVMPECVTTDPPLFRVGERRAASCFRHAGAAEIPAGDIRALLGDTVAAGD